MRTLEFNRSIKVNAFTAVGVMTPLYISLCADSVYRVVGMPRYVREFKVVFTKNLPVRPHIGANQPGCSKLYTMKRPFRPPFWGGTFCNLHEFYGSLNNDVKTLIARRYEQGYRYLYLTWRA